MGLGGRVLDCLEEAGPGRFGMRRQVGVVKDGLPVRIVARAAGAVIGAAGQVAAPELLGFVGSRTGNGTRGAGARSGFIHDGGDWEVDAGCP